MMKYTRTAIGLLTRQYRSVLKKCWLINVGLFALGAPIMAAMTASNAEAAVDQIRINSNPVSIVEGNVVNIAILPGSAAGTISFDGHDVAVTGALTTTGGQLIENVDTFKSGIRLRAGGTIISDTIATAIALSGGAENEVATSKAVALTVYNNTQNAIWDVTVSSGTGVYNGGTQVRIKDALDGFNTLLSSANTKATTAVQTVKLNGTALTKEDNAVDIKIATGSTAGTIKVGSGDAAADVAVNGVLTTSGGQTISAADRFTGGIALGDGPTMTATSSDSLTMGTAGAGSSTSTLATARAVTKTIYDSAEVGQFTVSGSADTNTLFGLSNPTIKDAINSLGVTTKAANNDIATLKTFMNSSGTTFASHAQGELADSAVQGITINSTETLTKGTDNVVNLAVATGTNPGELKIGTNNYKVKDVAITGANTFTALQTFGSAGFSLGGNTATAIDPAGTTNSATTLATTAGVNEAITANAKNATYDSSYSIAGKIGALETALGTTTTRANGAVSSISINGTPLAESTTTGSEGAVSLTFESTTAGTLTIKDGNNASTVKNIVIKDVLTKAGGDTITAADTFTGGIALGSGPTMTATSSNSLSLGTAGAGETVYENTLATAKAVTQTVYNSAELGKFSPSGDSSSNKLADGVSRTISGAINKLGTDIKVDEGKIATLETFMNTGANAKYATIEQGALANSALQTISVKVGENTAENLTKTSNQLNFTTGVTDGTFKVNNKEVAVAGVAKLNTANEFKEDATFKKNIVLDGKTLSSVDNGASPLTITSGTAGSATTVASTKALVTTVYNNAKDALYDATTTTTLAQKIAALDTALGTTTTTANNAVSDFKLKLNNETTGTSIKNNTTKEVELTIKSGTNSGAINVNGQDVAVTRAATLDGTSPFTTAQTFNVSVATPTLLLHGKELNDVDTDSGEVANSKVVATKASVARDITSKAKDGTYTPAGGNVLANSDNTIDKAITKLDSTAKSQADSITLINTEIGAYYTGGKISNLNTTNKTDLVSAINEVASSAGSAMQSIVVKSGTTTAATLNGTNNELVFATGSTAGTFKVGTQDVAVKDAAITSGTNTFAGLQTFGAGFALGSNSATAIDPAGTTNSVTTLATTAGVRVAITANAKDATYDSSNTIAQKIGAIDTTLGTTTTTANSAVQGIVVKSGANTAVELDKTNNTLVFDTGSTSGTFKIGTGDGAKEVAIKNVATTDGTTAFSTKQTFSNGVNIGGKDLTAVSVAMVSLGTAGDGGSETTIATTRSLAATVYNNGENAKFSVTSGGSNFLGDGENRTVGQAINALGIQTKTINNEIGNLNDLDTTHKTSLVAAINDVVATSGKALQTITVSSGSDTGTSVINSTAPTLTFAEGDVSGAFSVNGKKVVVHDVVKNSTEETITGQKTFTKLLTASNGISTTGLTATSVTTPSLTLNGSQLTSVDNAGTGDGTKVVATQASVASNIASQAGNATYTKKATDTAANNILVGSGETTLNGAISYLGEQTKAVKNQVDGLGTASAKNVEFFATAAQGANADSAVQSIVVKSGDNTAATLDKDHNTLVFATGDTAGTFKVGDREVAIKDAAITGANTFTGLQTLSGGLKMGAKEIYAIDADGVTTADQTLATKASVARDINANAKNGTFKFTGATSNTTIGEALDTLNTAVSGITTDYVQKAGDTMTGVLNANAGVKLGTATGAPTLTGAATASLGLKDATSGEFLGDPNTVVTTASMTRTIFNNAQKADYTVSEGYGSDLMASGTSRTIGAAIDILNKGINDLDDATVKIAGSTMTGGLTAPTLTATGSVVTPTLTLSNKDLTGVDTDSSTSTDNKVVATKASVARDVAANAKDGSFTATGTSADNILAAAGASTVNTLSKAINYLGTNADTLTDRIGTISATTGHLIAYDDDTSTVSKNLESLNTYLVAAEADIKTIQSNITMAANGTYAKIANTVGANLKLLDDAIVAEKARAEGVEGNLSDAIAAEKTRAEGVEGKLTDLSATGHASGSTSLVAAINAVDSALSGSISNLDNSVVHKAGDTMTGGLIVSSADGISVDNAATSAANKKTTTIKGEGISTGKITLSGRDVTSVDIVLDGDSNPTADSAVVATRASVAKNIKEQAENADFTASGTTSTNILRDNDEAANIGGALNVLGKNAKSVNDKIGDTQLTTTAQTLTGAIEEIKGTAGSALQTITVKSGTNTDIIDGTNSTLEFAEGDVSGAFSVNGLTVNVHDVVKNTTNDTISGQKTFSNGVKLGGSSLVLNNAESNTIALTKTVEGQTVTNGDANTVVTTSALAGTVLENAKDAKFKFGANGIITPNTETTLGGGIEMLNQQMKSVDDSVVHTAGDTMTGNLVVENAEIEVNNGASGSSKVATTIAYDGITTPKVKLSGSDLTAVETGTVALDNTAATTVVTSKALASTVKSNAQNADFASTGNVNNNVLKYEGKDSSTIAKALDILGEQADVVNDTIGKIEVTTNPTYAGHLKAYNNTTTPASTISSNLEALDSALLTAEGKIGALETNVTMAENGTYAKIANTVGTNLKLLDDAIVAEKARAEGVEGNLSDAIAAEKTRAEGVEGDLDDLRGSAAKPSTAAETDPWTLVDAINGVDSAVAAEALRAKGVEGSLSDLSATGHAAGSTSLVAAINAVDSALSGSISDLDAELDTKLGTIAATPAYHNLKGTGAFGEGNTVADNFMALDKAIGEIDPDIVKTNGVIPDTAPTKYVSGWTVQGTKSYRTTVAENLLALDKGISDEVTRATGVEGTLTSLNEGLAQGSLVAAINSENTRAKGAESDLSDAIANEKARAEGVEGSISNLTGNAKKPSTAAETDPWTLVDAINAVDGAAVHIAGDPETITSAKTFKNTAGVVVDNGLADTANAKTTIKGEGIETGTVDATSVTAGTVEGTTSVTTPKLVLAGADLTSVDVVDTTGMDADKAAEVAANNKIAATKASVNKAIEDMGGDVDTKLGTITANNGHLFKNAETLAFGENGNTVAANLMALDSSIGVIQGLRVTARGTTTPVVDQSQGTFYIYGEDKTYVDDAPVLRPATVAENLFALDQGLHAEVVRATGAEGDLTTLNEGLAQGSLVAAINSENARAKGVEGSISNLTGNAAGSNSLVDAINAVDNAAVHLAGDPETITSAKTFKNEAGVVVDNGLADTANAKTTIKGEGIETGTVAATSVTADTVEGTTSVKTPKLILAGADLTSVDVVDTTGMEEAEAAEVAANNKIAATKASVNAAIEGLDSGIDAKLGEITENKGNLYNTGKITAENSVASNLMKLDSSIDYVKTDVIGTIQGLRKTDSATGEQVVDTSKGTYYIYGTDRTYAEDEHKIDRKATVAENLFALDQGLHAEVVRATGAEGDLTTLKEEIKKTNLVDALNAEYDRAAVVEHNLYLAIVAEETRAKGVEGDLANLRGNAAKPAGSTAETWTLVDAINGVDNAAVHLAGDPETITSAKTFKNAAGVVVDNGLEGDDNAKTTIKGEGIETGTVDATVSVKTPKLLLGNDAEELSDVDVVDTTGMDADKAAEVAANNKIAATKASVNAAIEGLDSGIDAKLGTITDNKGNLYNTGKITAENSVASNLMALDSSLYNVKTNVIGEIKGTRLNGEILTAEDPQGYDHSTHYIYGKDVTRATGSADVVKDASIADNLLSLDTGLYNEVVRATGAEGDLTTLATEAKTSLVAAINELQGQTANYATKVEVHGNGEGTTVQLGDLADSTTIGQGNGVVSVASAAGTIGMSTQKVDGEDVTTTTLNLDGNTQTLTFASSDGEGVVYNMTVDAANGKTTFGSSTNDQIQMTGGNLTATGTVKAASLTLDNTVSKIDTGSVITSENADPATLATTQTIAATVGDVKGMAGNNFETTGVTVADQLARLDTVMGKVSTLSGTNLDNPETGEPDATITSHLQSLNDSIGNRGTYTEENVVTKNEAVAASINALDMALGDVKVFAAEEEGSKYDEDSELAAKGATDLTDAITLVDERATLNMKKLGEIDEGINIVASPFSETNTVAANLILLDKVIGKFSDVHAVIKGADISETLNNLDTKIDESAAGIEAYVNRRFAGGYEVEDPVTHETTIVHEDVVLGNLANNVTIGTADAGMTFEILDPDDSTAQKPRKIEIASTDDEGQTTKMRIDGNTQTIFLGSRKVDEIAGTSQFGVTIKSDLDGSGNGNSVVIGDGTKNVTIGDGNVTADGTVTAKDVAAESGTFSEDLTVGGTDEEGVFSGVQMAANGNIDATGTVKAAKIDAGEIDADKFEADDATINNTLTVGDPAGTNVVVKSDGSITSTVKEPVIDEETGDPTGNFNTKTVEIADGSVTAKYTDANNVIKEEITLDHGKIKATSKNRDDGLTGEVEISEGGVSTISKDHDGNVIGEASMKDGNVYASNSATIGSFDEDGEFEQGVQMNADGSITSIDEDGNTVEVGSGNVVASNGVTAGTVNAAGELVEGVQMGADGSITSIDANGNTVEIDKGGITASNADGSETVTIKDGSITSKSDEGEVTIADGNITASNGATIGTVYTEAEAEGTEDISAGDLKQGVQMGADGSITSKNDEGEVTIADGNITASGKIDAAEIVVDELDVDKGKFSESVTVGKVSTEEGHEGELVEGVQMNADGSITSDDGDGNTVEVAAGVVTTTSTDEDGNTRTVEAGNGAITVANADEDGNVTDSVAITDGGITTTNEDGETVAIKDGSVTTTSKTDDGAGNSSTKTAELTDGGLTLTTTNVTTTTEGSSTIETEKTSEVKIADGNISTKDEDGNKVEIGNGYITADNGATFGQADEEGELTQGVQLGSDGSVTVKSVDEEGNPTGEVKIANGNVDALSGAFKDSLSLDDKVVTTIEQNKAPITSESYIRDEGEGEEDYSDEVLVTAAALNGTVGDVATLGVGKEGTNLGTTGQETVADQVDALDTAMGDVKQFAAEDYEGYAKGANNLSKGLAQVDKQVVINADHIGSMVFEDVPVKYGVGAITGDDLTEAVSQLSSNIGDGKVLNSMAKRSEAAENNGVSSDNSVNENIAAVNATIGDLRDLSKDLKNLTNGDKKVPTTVVEALNNIDATFGRIHQLFDGEKVNTSKGGVESTTGSHSNLAKGTTVEMHLVSLDNAIGDRSSITNEKAFEGEDRYDLVARTNVADVLSDIASQIGTGKQVQPTEEVINGVSADNTVNQNIAAVNSAIGNVADLDDTYFLSDATNLTDAVKTLDTDIYQLSGAVNTTWRDLKELHHEFRRGMASMAAMSALVPNPRAHGKTSLSLGTGAYSGHGAVAVGGFHNITDNLMLNAGLAWSNSRDASYRMGVTYSF